MNATGLQRLVENAEIAQKGIPQMRDSIRFMETQLRSSLRRLEEYYKENPNARKSARVRNLLSGGRISP